MQKYFRRKLSMLSSNSERVLLKLTMAGFEMELF